MDKKIYLILVTLLAATLIISGCNKEIKAENNSNEAVAVKLHNIKKVNYSFPIKSSGRVTSSSEAKLSFKTGGIVEHIYVTEGQYVKKGQIIAKLNLSEITARVNQAKKSLEKTERDFNRIVNLYKEKVATLEQKQNLQTALDIAKDNYEIAKFNLKHSSITAPSNGKILKKFVEPNELVNAGTPIIYFGQSTNNWKIKVALSDVDLVKVNLNDSVDIKVDAYPNKTFKGKVSEIGQSANPLNGTFEIEIKIEDEKNLLVSGFIARVKIIPSESCRVAIVPIQSLVEANEKEACIFVPDNNKHKVIKKSVKISHLLQNEVVLFNTLDEFDEVVSVGAEYLKNGSQISVVKE